MKLGFVGLGRMGSRMVTKLLGEGHEVVVWNRSSSKVEELKVKSQPVLDRVETRSGKLKVNPSTTLRIDGERSRTIKSASQKLKVGKSIQDLVGQLNKPRVIWLMLPARSASSGSETGDATEEILGEVEKYVDASDILIDGGNAFFEDTQRRYEHFGKKGIRFLGIGVSGGIIAAREGYPLMVGGDQSAYDHVKPILDSLAKPHGGHEYFGEGGAGHFVKMVHNGIEYGIMQSIGEGFGVLSKSPYNLDLVKVAKLYQKGTLVSGFMMQRTIEALEKGPKLSELSGYIEDSGEGRWTVETAKRLKAPIGIIEKSLEFRTQSRKDKKVSGTFAAKLVAALRQAFGGHEVRKKVK